MGLSLETIAHLVAQTSARGLARFELDEGDVRLALVFRGSAADAAPQRPVAAAQGLAPPGVTASCVGRFWRRHPLAATAVPDAGDRVAAGDIVGFVLAGGLIHPVTAPRAGVLGAALVADGTGVGFGTLVIGLNDG